MKHWLSKTKIYYIWQWIKNRCNNKKVKAYKDYGWRWIKCEWYSFEDFYSDMWDSYKEWLSIERINNDWSYCKENCKWIEKKLQNNNTRVIIKIKWKTLSELSKSSWIKKITIYSRYKKGWSYEEILWIQIKQDNRWKWISWNARRIALIEEWNIVQIFNSINEASKYFNITHSLIYYVCIWKHNSTHWKKFIFI